MGCKLTTLDGVGPVGDETPPLSVTATYADGHTGTLSPFAVTWSASPGDMLSPDDLGAFDVLSPGSGTITATYPVGGATGTATVTVAGSAPDLDLDGPCTRSHLSNCPGRPMNQSELDSFRLAIDTGMVQDTGSCHDVRTWLLARPDSTLRFNTDSGNDGTINALSPKTMTTESVITIDSNTWSGRAQSTLTHVAMREGFHWWLESHPGNGDYTSDPLVNSLASACVKPGYDTH